jgi:hypothetical protein
MQPHLRELLEIHNAQLDAISEFVKRQPRFMPRYGESAKSHNERLSRDARRRRYDFLSQQKAFLEELKRLNYDQTDGGLLIISKNRDFEIELIGRLIIPCDVISLDTRR